MKFIALRRDTMFTLFLLCAAGIFVHAHAHHTESESAVAELTSLLQDFLANSAEVDTHARFWADELVYTSSNGTRLGKADIMQGFSGADEKDNAEPGVVYSAEDVKVQVYGVTAVVTFRLVGTPDDGSTALQYFNTGTFLKRDAEWRAVAWQATVIPSAEESK